MASIDRLYVLIALLMLGVLGLVIGAHMIMIGAGIVGAVIGSLLTIAGAILMAAIFWTNAADA